MALLAWGWFDVNLPAGKAHVPSHWRGHRAQNHRQMCQSHLEELFLCLEGPLCHLPLDLTCWTACNTSKDMPTPPHPKEGAPGGKKTLQGKKFEKHLSLGWGNFGGIRKDFQKWLVIIKKRNHGFVPKSPEVTREMTLDLSWSELKGMVHYIISTLYYKCLRSLGFLNIRQSTWWEALRWELQPSIFLSVTEMYRGHREH